nr:hypothetical protein [Gemmatimonas sp. UBA7669]
MSGIDGHRQRLLGACLRPNEVGHGRRQQRTGKARVPVISGGLTQREHGRGAQPLRMFGGHPERAGHGVRASPRESRHLEQPVGPPQQHDLDEVRGPEEAKDPADMRHGDPA